MLRKYTPVFISLGILYSIVIALLMITLQKNNGEMSYPLDDTFIHMAISKNFAEFGTWGITRYEFSSTTSSPLYTIVLAAVFLVVGSNIFIPLILNILFAAIFLLLINNLLLKREVSTTSRTIILLAVTFLMPLPILVISGMEHILHTILTLWFVFLGVTMLSADNFSFADKVTLTILGVFLGLSRYEGLFTVFAMCCLLFLRRQFIYAIILGVISILPVIIYGVISVQKGSYWLPNSVLLKGHQVSLLSMAGIESLYSKPLTTFSQASWLFTLSVVVALFFIFRYLKGDKRLWDFGQLLILIFFVTLIFHVEFAAVGWVYRYEAYLMAYGILILGIVWADTLSSFNTHFGRVQILTAFVVLFILSIPLLGRGISALKFGPKASNNIYEQQYQMGRFLKKYYNGEAIAANDIGAINYLADLKCLDIVGLGSIETAKAKREGRFSGKLVDSLARQKGVKIALVYDRELKNSPTDWLKIGEWKINRNVVGASDVVAFYAVEPREAENLKQNLLKFTPHLPSGVRVIVY